jgi:hypothetical protein
MKRSTLLIALFVSSISVIYTQNNSKVILKICGGTITDAMKFNYPYIDEQNPGGSWAIRMNVPHIRLETCYLPNNKIDFGFYVGTSKLTVPTNPGDLYSSGFIKDYAYFLGTVVNCHILPLLVRHPLRFDIYSTSKIGMKLQRWEGYTHLHTTPVLTENILEIGTGMGISYYFTQNFGVFGEILIGKFVNNNSDWKCGFNLKL